jgi:hypothetical protein
MKHRGRAWPQIARMQRSKPIRKEIPARAYEVWEERQQLVLNMLDERLSYEEIAIISASRFTRSKASAREHSNAALSTSPATPIRPSRSPNVRLKRSGSEGGNRPS